MNDKKPFTALQLENQKLREQLKIIDNFKLRYLEERDKAIEQRDAANRACNHFKRSTAALSGEVERLQMEVRDLKDELIKERNAYCALKARFHGANYGINPLYHNGIDRPHPKLTWKATFKDGSEIKGVVTFHKAPTIQELDQLQHIFEATSWSVILP